MEYPLPIDAAGRTALVILSLAFLRSEAVFWLRGLLGRKIPRSLWLDDCARFGPARIAMWCSLSLLRGTGRIVVLITIVLWSGYVLARLVDDLAEAPALTVLGGYLGIMTYRVVCH